MQQPEKNDKTLDKEVNNSNVTDIGKLIFCNTILKCLNSLSRCLLISGGNTLWSQ